ncbi:MAG: UbiA prenyltransferase family protein [Thaumarchaeota archaeon]|nr:UbiA prenyltransferase family protein [Nitrososphaerota archaeon]
MWVFESPALSSPLRNYISLFVSLAKSRSLVYGFVIATLGTFLIATSAHAINFSVAIRLLVSVYAIALATYVYNDLTDQEIDHRNEKKKSSGIQQDQYLQTRNYVVFFFALSNILAFSINWQTGLADSLAVALAIVYSHPKTHLKDKFILKTVITGSGGFIASIMGSLAVGNVPPLAFVASFTVFLFYFLLGPLGDITDMKGDKEAGRRTIPIVIGIPKSFFLMTSVVLFIASMIVASYFIFGLNIISMVIGLTICSYAIIQIKTTSKIFFNKEKMNKTRTILRFSFFGIQLALMSGALLSSVI